jgi:hypothetical protein
MRARAADDWSCPKSEVTVTSQGKDVFRVSGCGRSALYSCRAEGVAPRDPHSGSGAPPSESEYRLQGGGDGCYRLNRD